MEKDNQQNHFDNPVVALLVIAVLGLGGYVLFSNKSETSPLAENKTSNTIITTVYTKTTANVRSCASTDCKSIGTYAPNESFDLTGGPYSGMTDMFQLPDWLLLNFSDGTSGYISKTVLSDHQTTQNTQTENNSTVVTSNTSTNNTNTATKGLSEIVKEWRRDTAYVVCFWNYSNGTQYKAQSGSALSAVLNSVPTIITNKHVVYDPVSGYYANECDIRFPDDNGYYYYSKNTPNSNGSAYLPSVGNLTIDSNGNDVAFITGIGSSWTSLSSNYQQPADIPFSSHTKSNSYSCKSELSTGDPVLILGYPSYGTQMGSVLNSPAEPTATEGIISGRDGSFYTTSAKIEHGNSGGLAIDKSNDCYFGIPTWNESGSFESLGRILPVTNFLHY